MCLDHELCVLQCIIHTLQVYPYGIITLRSSCYSQAFTEGIPPDVLISMDETCLNYCPTGQGYTYAEKGSKTVAMAGADIKTAMTACVTTTAAGKYQY